MRFSSKQTKFKKYKNKEKWGIKAKQASILGRIIMWNVVRDQNSFRCRLSPFNHM
jgi:hypothetical protein